MATQPAAGPPPLRYAVMRLPPVEPEGEIVGELNAPFIPPSELIAPCGYNVRRLPPFPSPLLPWAHRHMPWYCPPALPTPACTHFGAGWGYYPTCWRAWPPFPPLCPPPVPPEFFLESADGMYLLPESHHVPAAEPVLPNPQPASEGKKD